MRRGLTHTLVILLMVTSLGAASRRSDASEARTTPAATPKSKKTVPKKRPKAYQVGKASWYGKKFQGRATASGEPYNMFQLTAAHRQLPLGTWVKVTNLKNGRWVIVRINDRGPVPENRILDLSYGAAQMLGIKPQGVARVRLDLLPEQNVAMANLAGME